MRLRRRLAEGAADLLGLQVLPRADVWDWPEDHYWRALFKALDIDCVFDVGANVGQYGQLLRSRGYRGLILSFEPAPATFATLAKTAAGDARWHVHPYAFGAEPGVLPFHEMERSVFSSFLTPSDDASLPFQGENVVTRTIEVEVRTIATGYAALAAAHGFARPFLKLDTQGYDLQVVNGAGAAMAAFRGVLSEVPRLRLYDGSPTLFESIAALTERGFDLARMFPVHPHLVLETIEFNAYFVNRPYARPSGSPS